MTYWIMIPAVFFVMVLLVLRNTNKQSRTRKNKNFRTNYYERKKAQQEQIEEK
jgi:hypothetical protein